ncbi:MAG: glycosyltransferase [Candidatus Paceibacterota bacterium]
MPRPLRILYVSMADLSRPNGPGVNETEFLLSLYAKFGKHVHAIVPRCRYPLSQLDGVSLTTYSHSSWLNPFGQVWSQADLFFKIRQILREEHFDFAVIRLSLFPLAVALHGKSLPPYFAKSLGEIQGFTRNGGIKGFIARMTAPMNLALFKKVIEKSHGLDCCTPQLAEQHRELLKCEPEEIEIVENATNVARFAEVDRNQVRIDLGVRERSPILGFVGGHPDQRGGRHIIRAVAHLRHQLPGIYGIIVGQDAGRRLTQLADELGVADRILLTGQIPYHLVPRYVAAFDIGFALDDSLRTLSTGNSYQKIRQYLSAGLHVITHGADLESLSDRGLVQLVDANQLEEICARIVTVSQLSQVQRNRHRVRALHYATENLSTAASLERRLEFWHRRTRRAVTPVAPSSERVTTPCF